MGYTPLVSDERSRGGDHVQRPRESTARIARCRFARRSLRWPACDEVDVDLEAKHVTIRGEQLDDAALRGAIAEAGYDVA